MSESSFIESLIPVSNKYNIFPVIVLSSLIVVASLIRGFPIPILPTSTYVIVVLTVLLINYSLILFYISSKIVLTLTIKIILLLLVTLVLSFIYNVYFFGHLYISARFLLEMLLNILIFISIFYTVNRKIIEKTFELVIAASTIIAVLLIIYALGVDEPVRRLGKGTTSLPVAINHLSHGFAIACSLAIGKLYDSSKKESIPLMISLFALSIPMLLSGSRAVSIPVLLSGATVLLLTYKSFLKRMWLLLISIGGIASLSVIGFPVRRLYARLINIDSFATSILARYDLISQSINMSFLTWHNILFGGGMYRYEPITETSNYIVYPHNYFVSISAHIGILFGIAFVLLYAKLSKDLLLKIINQGYDYLMVSTLISLIIIFAYISTSGKITRVITPWIFLGISANLLFNSEINDDNIR